MRINAWAVLMPLILGMFYGSAGAQVFRIPMPTPTPRPRPSPTPAPTPEPRALPCPNVVVQPQPAMVKDGQPVSFMANLAGGDPRVQPTILWNLSAGSIKNGQNTRRIEVDSTGSGATPDRQIVADVWVGGYAPECLLQAKATVKVIGSAVKFGEFGEVSPETLTFHAKTLADYMAQSQDMLFVLAYAGRKGERGFTYNWIKRIREELTAAGLSPRRISAIDAGFREEPLFDFWIVPPGSEPPRPAPTVDRREIVYPPTRPGTPKPNP